jgi:hypothetical protein
MFTRKGFQGKACVLSLYLGRKLSALQENAPAVCGKERIVMPKRGVSIDAGRARVKIKTGGNFPATR